MLYDGCAFTADWLDWESSVFLSVGLIFQGSVLEEKPYESPGRQQALRGRSWNTKVPRNLHSETVAVSHLPFWIARARCTANLKATGIKCLLGSMLKSHGKGHRRMIPSKEEASTLELLLGEIRPPLPHQKKKKVLEFSSFIGRQGLYKGHPSS